MRISDWSSDVCSSDLARRGHQNRVQPALVDQALPGVDIAPRIVAAFAFAAHVGDQRAAANLPRGEQHVIARAIEQPNRPLPIHGPKDRPGPSLQQGDTPIRSEQTRAGQTWYSPGTTWWEACNKNKKKI